MHARIIISVFILRHDVGLAARRVHTSRIPQSKPDVDQNVGRCGHIGPLSCVEVPEDTRLSAIRSK